MFLSSIFEALNNCKTVSSATAVREFKKDAIICNEIPENNRFSGLA
jgi:hypothetical protein